MKVQPSIIEECLKGNQRSCEQLYNLYLPYCYGICKRYGIANSEIKDQIQIIFSNMFKALQSFDSKKASFKTWFTRITINNIIEERRKKSRQLQFTDVAQNQLVQEFASHSGIDQDMGEDYIMNILSRMPSHFRNVFNMFVIDGYSHKEIANKLEISEASSRTTLKRGRDWAKKALNNYLQSSH